MKNKVFILFASALFFTLVLTGCAKVPKLEIDAAQEAIENVKVSGAELYAHDAYVLLNDSMKSAMVTIEAQNSKFFKNYSYAKEQLAGVTKFAGEVKLQTEAKIAEVKAEVEKTIPEAVALIEQNRKLIGEAPKGKEGSTALEAMKEEINALEASINEANSLFLKGEYLQTLDKAKATKEKLSMLNTELSDVIAKYNANIKARKR